MAALLALAGALAGCSHQAATVAPAPPPRPVVLDYRNGWYHTASGVESVTAIAERYKRDLALVAELNHAGANSVPVAGKLFYIPPSNDRMHVRDVLVRLQGHPEMIPKTPWDPNAARPAQAQTQQVKTASPAKVKHKDQPAAPLERKVAARAGKKKIPANPMSADHVAPSSAVLGPAATPPPPDRKEVALAGSKPKKKRSFFGWLGFGRSKEKKASAPIRVMVDPVPPPRPAPPPDAFVWPVRGKVVTPYKGGWHQACHGIEIAAAEGTPVQAARAGKVLLAQAYPGYGNLVLIDHGDGYATAYGYNRQMLVREGQSVQRGQTIASVGRPTQGSSSKLLFQVRRNALPVDPMTYLKKT